MHISQKIHINPMNLCLQANKLLTSVFPSLKNVHLIIETFRLRLRVHKETEWNRIE